MAYQTPYYNRVQARRSASSARPKQSMRAQPLSDDGSGFLKDMDYNQIAGGINQGLSSFAQGQADTYDFSIDPMAGYKGSFQGFASGGAIGAIAGGVGGQLGTFSQVNKNLKALNTDVNLTDKTGPGQPSYVGGAFLDTENKLKALDEGYKDANKQYDPATMVFNEIFGTSSKILRKKNELNRKRTQAQQDFNSTTQKYENEQLILNDYYSRSNIDNQLANLYR